MGKRHQLEDVFGGGQVAPGGTGAILTQPSALSASLAEEVVKQMPLDAVYRDLGAVAARVVADEMDIKMLRPADFANLSDLPGVVAARIVEHLGKSEEFAASFRRHLKARG